MKKWLINPFVYLAGIKAFMIGLLIIILTSMLCTLSNSHMDGVLDFHPKAQSASFLVFMVENLVNLLSISLVLYLFGRIISSSAIRVIDVLGTQALARLPFLFAPVIGIFAPDPKGFLSAIQSKSGAAVNSAAFNSNEVLFIMGYSLLVLIPLIWIIAMMYNAFSISCNLKKVKGALSFAFGLLLSEILSKLIIGTIYKYL